MVGGDWDITNRGFCHKLEILVPEWQERKETQRLPFKTKLLPMYISETTGGRIAFQTHTHKNKTYKSHHKDTMVIKTNGQKRNASKLILGLCIS